MLEQQGIEVETRNDRLYSVAGELPVNECMGEVWVVSALYYQTAERLVSEMELASLPEFDAGSVMHVTKRLMALLRFAGTVRLRQQILLSVRRSKSEITATGFMPRVRSNSDGGWQKSVYSSHQALDINLPVAVFTLTVSPGAKYSGT